MANKNFVYPITMATYDSSNLTTSYATMNSTGNALPLVILKIVNNSNQDVTISFDGTTDHDFVPAGGFSLYDYQANTVESMAMLRIGTVIYGKGAAAGSGNVYIVGYTLNA